MRIRITFNTDPDPAFHFNADPEPAEHFNADLNADPTPRQSDLLPLVCFEPLKLLNFVFDADPDLAFHCHTTLQ